MFLFRVRALAFKPKVRGWVWGLPRGSYPTPFFAYLVLRLGSVILKNKRPKKGVGYEPLGRVEVRLWALDYVFWGLGIGLGFLGRGLWI